MLLNQNNRLGVTFSGNYMKQNKLGSAHGTVINAYIVYELKNITATIDFTVANGLFGAVKITKDADTLNYKHSGYGICFDSKSDFSTGSITNGKNVIIFGSDMSFSSHERNRGINISFRKKRNSRREYSWSNSNLKIPKKQRKNNQCRKNLQT